MNKPIQITHQAIQSLNILTEKIRLNQASVAEYNEYENILIQSGAFNHNEIMSYLSSANLNNYNDLIAARNRAKTIEDKKLVEGVAVVGLVALGLALIFSGSSRK